MKNGNTKSMQDLIARLTESKKRFVVRSKVVPNENTEQSMEIKIIGIINCFICDNDFIVFMLYLINTFNYFTTLMYCGSEFHKKLVLQDRLGIMGYLMWRN